MNFAHNFIAQDLNLCALCIVSSWWKSNKTSALNRITYSCATPLTQNLLLNNSGRRVREEEDYNAHSYKIQIVTSESKPKSRREEWILPYHSLVHTPHDDIV